MQSVVRLAQAQFLTALVAPVLGFLLGSFVGTALQRHGKRLLELLWLVVHAVLFFVLVAVCTNLVNLYLPALLVYSDFPLEYVNTLVKEYILRIPWVHTVAEHVIAVCKLVSYVVYGARPV